MSTFVYWLSMSFAAGVAVTASYQVRGNPGAAGAGAGILLAVVLCLVSQYFSRAAQKAEGHAVISAVLGGVIATFLLLIGSVVVAQMAWKEGAASFSLTALALYAIHRGLHLAASKHVAGGSAGRGEQSSSEAEAVKTEDS